LVILFSEISPPLLKTMLTMLYIGPARIALTISATTSRQAIHALLRTRPLRGFLILTATIVSTIANASTTPMPIR